MKFSTSEAVRGTLSFVLALPAGPPAAPWKTKGFTNGWLLSFELCLWEVLTRKPTDMNSDATSQGLVLVAAHTELPVGVRTHSKAWWYVWLRAQVCLWKVSASWFKALPCKHILRWVNRARKYVKPCMRSWEWRKSQCCHIAQKGQVGVCVYVAITGSETGGQGKIISETLGSTATFWVCWMPLWILQEFPHSSQTNPQWLLSVHAGHSLLSLA